MSTEISASLLRDRNLLETLRFIYAAEPVAFSSTFSKNGVSVESINDLPVLASMEESFKNGIKTPSGGEIKFNIWDVIRSINIHQPNLESSGIRLVA